MRDGVGITVAEMNQPYYRCRYEAKLHYVFSRSAAEVVQVRWPDREEMIQKQLTTLSVDGWVHDVYKSGCSRVLMTLLFASIHIPRNIREHNYRLGKLTLN